MKSKSFLQQQAYDYIKDKILSGAFDPEVLYSETKLSAEIGVSRTPMREALQCLSQDGYIRVVPSKGFKIRQLTEADMLESIQVRCAIEGYCTTVIASQIDSPAGRNVIQSLKTTLDQMRLYAKTADTVPASLESFISYDHQFHLTIIEYAGNQEFEQVFQRLMYLIRLTSNTTLSKSGRIQETVAEHESYFNALKNGNPHTAYDLLMKHLTAPLSITEKK